MKEKIFKFIKADPFFRTYLPGIKNYARKINGKNGRGNPADFSPDENKQIKNAVKRMLKDIIQ